MSADQDSSPERDRELLRAFSTAPTVAERAEALRQMYAEKRTGRLKASLEFRAGVDGLGASVSAPRDGERLAALATLERIRSLSSDMEQVVDRVTAPGLAEPLASLAACESGEDRARVAAVIGRHRPAWAARLLAHTAALEPALAGGKPSKARKSALEGLLLTVGTVDEALLALADTLDPGTAGAPRRLAAVLRDLRTVFATRREAIGDAPGKALAALAKALDPKGEGASRPEQLREAAEEVALFMHELVRARASFAGDLATYAALTPIRDWMHAGGGTGWADLARSSPALALVREDLADAILGKARLEIPDDALLQKLHATCASRDAADKLCAQLATRDGLKPAFQRWLQGGELNPDQRPDPFAGLRAESEIGRIAQMLLDGQRLDAAMRQVSDTVIPEVELVAPRLISPLRAVQNLAQAVQESARALAAGRGLRSSGTPGEIVDYLPSHHRLTGGPFRGVTRVKILTPAVEEVASDGTTRVVVQAVVEVSTDSR